MTRLLILPLFCASLLFGAVITGNSESANAMLKDCTFNQVTLDYESGNLELIAYYTQGSVYTLLRMPGTFPSSEIGSPQLPVYRVFVEIPQDAVPNIEITEPVFREIELAKCWVPQIVYPRQAPVPKIKDYIPEFAMDAKSYSREKPQFESVAQITDIIDARDHRIAVVEIHPVNYTPATGMLTLLESGTIKLNTPNGSIEKTALQKEQHRSPIYDNIVNPLIVNSQFYSALWVVPTEIEMIIITTDSFSTSLTNLTKWKKRKGFVVDFKLKSTIGTTTTALKNYIQTQYTADDVDFIILVGDVGNIPTFTGSASSSSSDNPYTELSGGDYIPDAFIGRLSLASNAQVTEMANRILNYEHFTFGTGTSWTQGACLPASNDGTYHGLCEATQRYVAQTRYGPAGYTRIDTIWGASGGTGAQVLASTNSGVMILNYTGHGDWNLWAGPDVSQAQVRALTNSGKYPMVISNACLTGTFGEYSECFMETWIRQTSKGAIGAIGASNSSYWDEDDIFERRMIDSVFVNEWMFTSGLRLKGLMAVNSGYPSSSEYYFDMYNLLGDPSIALWWNVPVALAATHPASTLPGSGSIAVTVTSGGSPVQNALVCITNDSTIQNAAYTNASGIVSLSYSGAAMGDTIRVTATAYKKIPYEGSIPIAGSGPYIAYDHSTIQADGTGGTTGDGDVNADAGERISLRPYLHNTGTATANGVTGKLSESSSYANVTDSTANYGNIAAGATVAPADPFIIQMLGTPADSTEILFSLRATDTPGTTWTAQVPIRVFAPRLVVSSCVNTDLGDADGFFEPGEQVGMTFRLKNTGHDIANSVSGTISESDPNISVTVASGTFGTIAAGDSATNSSYFRISISAGCPTPYSAAIIFNGSETRGYAVCDTISILVGTGGFRDDAESGISLWTTASPWHVTDFRKNSSVHSFYAGPDDGDNPFQNANSTNASIVTTNPVILPANPVLNYWHFYEVEYNYDSCYVEISTDGGTGWSVLSSYTGSPKSWKFGYSSLSGYGSAGDDVLIRFRLKTDAGVLSHGWFVDDVHVESAQNAYIGGGDVFPWAAASGDTFTFKVIYASPSSVTPTSVNVYIDGIPYSMSTSTGSITTGITYSYKRVLTAGSHNFRYEITAGSTTFNFPQTGTFAGPQVGSPTYNYDIGTANGGFTTSSFTYHMDWEWGHPTYGPSTVPSGTNCWATNLDGNYTDTSQSRLITPAMTIPATTGIPYLVFWHWYRFQPGATSPYHDGGNVKLVVDATDTFVIFPQCGYDGESSQYNQLNSYQPVFADTFGKYWHQEAFNLKSWAGHSVRVYFDFGASYRNNEAGWYINRVSMYFLTTTGIEENGKPLRITSPNISISPNPFNSACEISISNLDVNEKLNSIEIFDISGKMIDAMPINAKRTAIWKPAEKITSGVYFARIQTSKTSYYQKVMLIR